MNSKKILSTETVYTVHFTTSDGKSHTPNFVLYERALGTYQTAYKYFTNVYITKDTIETSSTEEKIDDPFKYNEKKDK